MCRRQAREKKRQNGVGTCNSKAIKDKTCSYVAGIIRHDITRKRDGSKNKHNRCAGNNYRYIHSPKKITPTGPSQAEILLRVTSGIAAELIKAYDSNESVSLNEIRAKLSKKHGFGGVPRLVDIISAIPDDYKKALLPKLKARPIRTASGVSLPFFFVDEGRKIFCLSISVLALQRLRSLLSCANPIDVHILQ
jgi:hypothetical protein